MFFLEKFTVNLWTPPHWMVETVVSQKRYLFPVKPIQLSSSDFFGCSIYPCSSSARVEPTGCLWRKGVFYVPRIHVTSFRGYNWSEAMAGKCLRKNSGDFKIWNIPNRPHKNHDGKGPEGFPCVFFVSPRAWVILSFLGSGCVASGRSVNPWGSSGSRATTWWLALLLMSKNPPI